MSASRSWVKSRSAGCSGFGIELRSQPRVPAEIEVLGVVQQPDLDRAVLVGREPHRIARLPAGQRAVEVGPADGRREAGQTWAVPAPPRTARAISGGLAISIGRDGDRLLDVGQRADGVLLRATSPPLRRPAARPCPCRNRPCRSAGSDRRSRRRTRRAADRRRTWSGENRRPSGKTVSTYSPVLGVEQDAAARLVDHAQRGR